MDSPTVCLPSSTPRVRPMIRPRRRHFAQRFAPSGNPRQNEGGTSHCHSSFPGRLLDLLWVGCVCGTLVLSYRHTLRMMGGTWSSAPPPAADPPPNAPNQSVKPTATIAYAISLIKCGDKQSTSAGLVDAALVMRHSIHMQSIRNPRSGSRYDYRMYAIVHRDAVECSGVLREAGFVIVVRDPPVQPSDIRGEYLRKTIHREWCCGHDELVKLYAVDLPASPTTNKEPEPIVVHVDIDFAFYRPMDDLYDAMLFSKDSPQGRAARARIPLERPDDPWPDRVDAFITRDYPQLLPGRIPGYQAGFWVARRDPTVVPEVLEIVREGHYVEGFSRNNGWGGMGYGGYVGGMAMQGLMAYYYDVVRNDTVVELNSCRFNHMGMDNLYRAHPSFRPKSPWVGKCRSTRADCEDCTTTNASLIYNVHYTQCRKPWNCISEGVGKGSIDTKAGKLDHCLELIHKWHQVRKDLEDKLIAKTQDKTISKGMTAKYKPNLFLGHCQGEGGHNYTNIQGAPETFLAIPSLYGSFNDGRPSDT